MGKIKEIHNATKDKILEIAGRFFVKHSYRGVSLGMIAEKVGIKKASLYYYFKNKEDIYFGSLDIILDELNEIVEEVMKRDIPSDKKARELIIAFISFSVKKEKFIRAIIQNFPVKKRQMKRFFKIKQKRDNMVKIIEPLMLDCIGPKGKKMDLKVATYILIGGLNMIMEEHIYSEDKQEFDPKVLADKFYEIMFVR
ncbi:MAG: TetR/AcrR family transcriptional regulator [Candidatus Pacebacteria bacterium]|nr:TetR/AcrR family transcriptional regulator [Candidatus Paceibacterota bacterium]